MSNTDEIRWQQRFENFSKALGELKTACEQGSYLTLERAGLIQLFEVCFELQWKVLKDLLFYEGIDAKSPRAAIRQGFGYGLLTEGETESLLDALDKRNLFSHLYDKKRVEDNIHRIRHSYVAVFVSIHRVLKKKLP